MLANTRHRDLVRAQTILAYASLTTAVTVVVGICIASGPLCLATAAPVAAEILGTLGPTLALASWPLFIQQMALEYEPNNLVAIGTSDGGFDLQLFTSQKFTVFGKFVPLSAETQWEKVASKAISDLVFSLFPIDSLKFPAVIDLVVRLSVEITQIIIDQWKDSYIPILVGDSSRIVPLGAASVSIAYLEDQPDGIITLACGDNTTASVYGRSRDSFSSDAVLSTSDKFLMLAPTTVNRSPLPPTPPQVWFQVLVVDKITVVDFTVLSRSVIGGKSTKGILTINRPLPGNITIRLHNPSGTLGIPSVVVIPAGVLTTEFTIDTRPVSSIDVAQIYALYGWGSKGSSQLQEIRLFPAP